MREALFIKKNKDRWLRVQHMPSSDPDEMAADFVQLVDDLAYAKTFYPSGKVTGYINTQASKIYLDIYKNRKEESNRLITFWRYDVPLTIRRHYKTVLFAFLFFSLFFLIGFFLALKDESLIGSLMHGDGDEYLKMTKENIRNNNPFHVYENGNTFLMWMGIMVNNILVALRDFAGGLFLGLPSLYNMGKFAVEVGAFNEIFYTYGHGAEFWLVVFAHGTLEITAFILVGAAGLILGKSYLFPGTIRRLDSLKQGAKDGVKIVIAILPVLALAAFFEGFVTRMYNNKGLYFVINKLRIPWFTGLITLLSVAFIIWYFIILPVRVGRRHAAHLNEEEV